MRVVKCTKCGKYIHEARRCFHCGAEAGFEVRENARVPVHENVVDVPERIERSIEGKKYEEAYALSYTVMEWMPDLALIYWLRLLAKHQCSSDAELVTRGFDCENDSNLLNALDFASCEEEKSAYSDVRALTLAVRNGLRNAVWNHYCGIVVENNLPEINNTIKTEIDAHKEKIFSLWSSLEDVESRLRSTEAVFNTFCEEHKLLLSKAESVMEMLNQKTSTMEYCSDQEYFRYCVEFDSAQSCSAQAKDAVSKVRARFSPLFNDLQSQRDKLKRDIEVQIKALQDFGAPLRETMRTVLAPAKTEHEKVLSDVDGFNFVSAYKLLGVESAQRALQDAGIAPAVLSDILNTYQDRG